MSERPPEPPGPAIPDRFQIERLNGLWAIIDSPVPMGSGLRGRLRAQLIAAARRLLERLFARQQEFNAAIVDHINRNMAVMESVSRVGANIGDLIDEMRRYREALLARERRSDAAVAALSASQAELRTSLGVLQQAAQSMKRELSRRAPADQPVQVLADGPGPWPRPGSFAVGSNDADAPAGSPPPAAPASQFAELDSHKYVGFEDQFRGSEDDIRARVAEYLPIFSDTSDVLDLGCGRGEFIALLREHGISSRGIDLNPAMVEVCRERGLDAVAADALTYLRGVPDQSLGGLFAAQVVEHLEPGYLVQLLDAAFDKLRPGAPIVLETINPACWFAFFESYVRDITHVRPLHPDTLRYLLMASGFQHTEIRYRAPYPESEKLQAVAALPAAGAAAGDWVETINANAEKINRLLFSWLDYAAIGRRP